MVMWRVIQACRETLNAFQAGIEYIFELESVWKYVRFSAQLNSTLFIKHFKQLRQTAVHK